MPKKKNKKTPKKQHTMTLSPMNTTYAVHSNQLADRSFFEFGGEAEKVVEEVVTPEKETKKQDQNPTRRKLADEFNESASTPSTLEKQQLEEKPNETQTSNAELKKPSEDLKVDDETEQKEIEEKDTKIQELQKDMDAKQKEIQEQKENIQKQQKEIQEQKENIQKQQKEIQELRKQLQKVVRKLIDGEKSRVIKNFAWLAGSIVTAVAVTLIPQIRQLKLPYKAGIAVLTFVLSEFMRHKTVGYRNIEWLPESTLTSKSFLSNAYGLVVSDFRRNHDKIKAQTEGVGITL